MKLFYFTLIFIIIYNPLNANFGSPLRPTKDPVDQYIGVLLGLGQNFHYGQTFANCPDCVFNNGVGFGYTFGFNYERQLNTDKNKLSYFINYGGLIHLSNMGYQSEYTEIRDEVINSNNQTYYSPLRYKHNSDVSISRAGIMPYIAYYPIKYLHLRIGLDVSLLFRNNSKQTTELLDRRVTLPNGEVSDVFIQTSPNSTRRQYALTLQDEPISDINKIYPSFCPAIGGNIYLNEKLLFSPSLAYTLGISKLSNNYAPYGVNT